MLRVCFLSWATDLRELQALRLRVNLYLPSTSSTAEDSSKTKRAALGESLENLEKAVAGMESCRAVALSRRESRDDAPMVAARPVAVPAPVRESTPSSSTSHADSSTIEVIDDSGTPATPLSQGSQWSGRDRCASTEEKFGASAATPSTATPASPLSPDSPWCGGPRGPFEITLTPKSSRAAADDSTPASPPWAGRGPFASKRAAQMPPKLNRPASAVLDDPSTPASPGSPSAGRGPFSPTPMRLRAQPLPPSRRSSTSSGSTAAPPVCFRSSSTTKGCRAQSPTSPCTPTRRTSSSVVASPLSPCTATRRPSGQIHASRLLASPSRVRMTIR